MQRIVVTRRLPGDAHERIRGSADVRVWPDDRPIPRDVLEQQVADADGLLCMLTDRIDAPLLERAPSLQVVSTMAVGTDNIDVDACTERGIRVGNTPDVLNGATADMAIALLLAAARRIPEGMTYVREGRWRRWEPELLLGAEVHGSTLGIVGMGRIGTEIARRGLGFGMRVLYHNRHRRPEIEAQLGTLYRSLDELLAESDHVVLSCPLTEETYHLIDAQALDRMQPTATLINIARGPIVDPRALEHALRTGQIFAAALDVTEPEPIPADDPLLALPNCLIVPHLGSATVQTRKAMADLAVDNLLAGLRGEPMPACVNCHLIGR